MPEPEDAPAETSSPGIINYIQVIGLSNFHNSPFINSTTRFTDDIICSGA